jgi:ABC-type phosphate/phosphonate transport system permease subunit
MRQGTPPRFEQPGILAFAAWLAVVAFFVVALSGTKASLGDLVSGAPQIVRLVGEMLPPSTARLGPVGWALLETFQMAFVGTVFGVLLSVPLAVLATRHLSPHPAVYHAARTAIAFFRTVPDLVWALLFVVSVGLGPFAGVLAIIVDKLGFCGRFFAEAMEEADRGPQEALSAIGARRSALVALLRRHLPVQPGEGHALLRRARPRGRRRHRHRAEGGDGPVQLRRGRHHHPGHLRPGPGGGARQRLAARPDDLAIPP